MPAAAEYMPSSIRRGDRPREGRLEEEVDGSAAQARDLRGGLLEGLVDRLDRLLARLQGAQRGHHVDHRARRVDARALEGAGADGARGGTGGGAGEQRVADLPGALEREDAD